MFRSDSALQAPIGAVAALGLAVALLATGCAAAGDGGDGGDGGDANLAITFLPKNLGNAYFDTADAGGEEAIEEFGGTYAEVGPAKGSPDGQVSYINTLTQQGVGAIAISANDPAALCDAIGEARDAGVKVVTFDSDTSARLPRPVHQPGRRRGHRARSRST